VPQGHPAGAGYRTGAGAPEVKGEPHGLFSRSEPGCHTLHIG